MSELHVVFRVDESDYALPADQVLHMASFEGATRVPHTADYVVGLAQVRNQVVPVVDLRARFGLPPIDRGLDARVLVTRVHERTVGLLVDRAREVLHLDPGAFRPPPELVARQTRGWVRAVAEPGDRLVILLDLEKVISEEDVHGEEEGLEAR